MASSRRRSSRSAQVSAATACVSHRTSPSSTARRGSARDSHSPLPESHWISGFRPSTWPPRSFAASAASRSGCRWFAALSEAVRGSSSLSSARDKSRRKGATRPQEWRVELGMELFRRLAPMMAVLGMLAFAACKKSDSSKSADSRAIAQEPASPSGNAPGPDGTTQTKEAGTPAARAETRKVIRTGSVRLTVATYDEARAKLDALLAQIGGYVDSTHVNRGHNSVTD